MSRTTSAEKVTYSFYEHHPSKPSYAGMRRTVVSLGQPRGSSVMMNRPRNRPPRERSAPNRDHTGDRSAYAAVPSIQEVIPGASVSIVLKADQGTGREVQGVVQDLLTRGNHPRGIKVRLRDGRIGRVQSMVREGISTTSSTVDTSPIPSAPLRSSRVARMVQDVRNEPQFPSMPPPRSLLEYVPVSNRNRLQQRPNSNSTPDAICPVCSEFRGDELAVARHVDEHFRDG